MGPPKKPENYQGGIPGAFTRTYYVYRERFPSRDSFLWNEALTFQGNEELFCDITPN